MPLGLRYTAYDFTYEMYTWTMLHLLIVTRLTTIRLQHTRI